MAPTVGNFTIWFCSHLFLRSVDMAARDFLEQNGLNDLIKLVVEENKVQCYGYNWFSFYDQFKRWTIKIRHTRLSTLVFGSTLPFYSTELVEKNGTTFTWIQKPIFTCVKPNAYITNALIHCRLFLPNGCLPVSPHGEFANAHSLLRSFGSEWLEERGDMCSSCFKITKCAYTSSVVLYIWSHLRLLPSLIAFARKTTSSFPQLKFD